MMSKWANIVLMLVLSFALFVSAQAEADANGIASNPSYPRAPVPAGPQRPGPKTVTPPGEAKPSGPGKPPGTPPKPSAFPGKPPGTPPKPSAFPGKPGKPSFPGGPPPAHTYHNTTLTTSAIGFSLSATASVTSAPVTGTASLWEQCGGKSYTGPSACIVGAYCSHQDDWYAQCVTSAPIPGYQTLWGQCGGVNYKGLNKCQQGFECSTFNEYYAQCLLPTASA
ncbi:unnamed protein product [Kuraishia capsulata CBS 1993]|uniref:CBM1 domain-containing protein n=1 Tax=Kuraishia capsulata CBS 1993 TaxID=1382522 RepID=W6MKY1_9ASCO|nr:uncharacterized protein KUCA_T00001402001 [Kuraishia capsulata CBS 1993]CDK25432.1 unnamed protein product [Kuraishia capsulata CBS 1993]